MRAATCFLFVLAGCATVEPVAVAPAPSPLSGVRIKLPQEIILTGERLDAALSEDPNLAQTVRTKLAGALEQAGYTPVTDGGAFDLQLEASVAVLQVSRSIATGLYANLSGRLRVASQGTALDTLRAISHPEDARFYPTLEEATDRVVGQLVNAMGQSPRVREGIGAPPATQAAPADESGAPALDAPTDDAGSAGEQPAPAEP